MAPASVTPTWMMMVHTYQTHGIFLSDRTLNKLLIIQSDYWDHLDEVQLFDAVFGLTPSLVNPTIDFDTVRDSVAHSITEIIINA
eukprot:scaffold40284_cov404-Isochrysis_galbana.AAC.1